jgi:peptide/nickel transport system permease protein
MRVVGRTRLLLSTASGRAGAFGLVVLTFLAIAAPHIWGEEAEQTDVAAMLQGPSWAHPAGTDGLGRDVLARVLVATRPSLGYALLATAVAAAVGIGVGLLPAVLGHRAAQGVSGAINTLIAFPGLILALFVAVVFGVGARGAVVALGVAGAPVLARLTNTLASSVAGSDYVAAARVLGVSHVRLLRRHVLPNIAEPLVLNVTTAIGSALLAFSALSFLGLGLQPPFYDWGRMLSEGLERIYISPAAALAPAAAIVLAGLTFNLLGDGLAQVSGGRVDSAAPTVQRRRRVKLPVTPAPADVENLVLDVVGLSVTFPSPGGDIHAARDVSLAVRRGELVGIVGESGSGKTVTALAIAQLVSYPGELAFERLRFDGRDVGALSPGERRRLLATSLPMVFQNPGTTLNPASRVGRQLAEVSEVHGGLSRAAATARAEEKLRHVAIAAPRRRLRAYPHELSGGMKQRAVIAMGLMGEPKLYIADEPTTALDVTVQRQIFDLLRRVNVEEGASVLLISHDIAAIAELCTRVVVMYGGRVVEEASVAAALHGAAHPYTRALVAAVPDMEVDCDAPLASIPGRPPDPRRIDAGCAFAPRCPFADDRCQAERPRLEQLADGWRAACWHPRAGDSELAGHTAVHR